MTEPMVRVLHRATRKRMNSHVTVEERTGVTFDEDTGATVDVYSQVYEGPALVRSSGSVGRTAESGDSESVLHTIRVVLADNTVPPIGSRVTVDASSVDANLVGKVFYVDDYDVQDRRTWRVLICTEAR